MEAHMMRKVVNAAIRDIRFDSSAIDGCGTCIMIRLGRVEPNLVERRLLLAGRLDLTGYH